MKRKSKFGKESPHWKGGKLKHICIGCKREHEKWPFQTNKKYCSNKCRLAHEIKNRQLKKCLYCGKPFSCPPCRTKRRFCSLNCCNLWAKGERSPFWKGGKIKTVFGYITTYAPTHPYCNSLGHVMEHRLKMESHLGRHLLPTEIVHHINGIKDDNRIENLGLFSSRSDHAKHHHPKGEKVKRLITKGFKKGNVPWNKKIG